MICVPARAAPRLILCAYIYAALHSPTNAGIKEDVGVVTLQAERGMVPTGTSVKVAMTEAVVNGGYTPMTDLPDFAGKHFEFRSGSEGNSAHATWVAQNFFGLSNSIAPGINTIELYDANDYLSGGFLHPGSRTSDPEKSPQNSRVGNHSWISMGTDLNGTLDILERQDWVIERDDYIQVVGVNNAEVNTNPLMSNAMNAIAVGRSDGIHATNTVPLAGPYTGYRVRPEIVAPMSFTSFSTPVVAAASSLLVQTAHDNPSLSAGSYTPARFPGTTIYHAETSEVIKAALLAGASRLVFNSGDGSAIVDYRAAASRQANNGLDKRFGAGQLNVYNSVSIISGREQNSAADGGPANITAAGFDYDPHFGGLSGANATGTYDFTAGWTGQSLTASLAWNVKIDIDKVKQNDPQNAATLYDLNLALYDITQTPTLVASSNSPTQNTENIWTSLVGGRRYRLEVSRGGAQTPFDWDYGLAWSTVGTIGWQGMITNVWSEGLSFSWTKGSSPAGYLPGEHVVFGDWGINGQVIIVGSVAPGSVLVDNNTRPYAFMGGSISGASGLVKRGPGLLSVTNSNSYAGPTLIQAGKLALYANGGLGSTAQGTTVSPGAAIMLPGGVNYALPEPLTISGQGPAGQGALENAGGDNHFAGPVTVSGNATIGVAGGNLAVTGRVTLPISAALDKNGPGVLSLRGGMDWGSSSAMTVSQGVLRLEPAAGSLVNVSATAPTLTLGPGVARVNAAAQDPFSDDQNLWQRVNVANNVPNGLTIEAGVAFVRQLSGPGSTLVATGAHLVADRISQSDLSIGAGGRVSLWPGGGTSVINSLQLNAAIAIVPEENVFSLGLGAESSWAPNPINEISGVIGSVTAIPEPASIALVAGTLLFVLAAATCRRMAVGRSIGKG